jgi:hypothetical protein
MEFAPSCGRTAASQRGHEVSPWTSPPTAYAVLQEPHPTEMPMPLFVQGDRKAFTNGDDAAQGGAIPAFQPMLTRDTPRDMARAGCRLPQRWHAAPRCHGCPVRETLPSSEPPARRAAGGRCGAQRVPPSGHVPQGRDAAGSALPLGSPLTVVRALQPQRAMTRASLPAVSAAGGAEPPPGMDRRGVSTYKGATHA